MLITTAGQSGPGSKGNEGVFHTFQILKSGASPSDAVLYHTQNTPFWVSLNPLQEVQSAYSKACHQSQ